MQRTQISLSDAERQLLDHISAQTGRSMSALIREAITGHFGPSSRSRDEVEARLDAAFGLWADRDETGEQYVDRVRDGRGWQRVDR